MKLCKIIKSIFRTVVIFFTIFFCFVSLGSINKKQNHSKPDKKQTNKFQFPTSDDGATFNFTSIPDLFNWNIMYPQPGWEESMDWFLEGMKKEGPAFMLNAGDIMDARWWKSQDQVRKETNYWWSGFRKRFEDKDIKIYIAPGDHEYGDDQGLTKMNLVPVFAQQFRSIFDMPKNGPEHMKGLAYSFSMENLAVISVNTFEDAGIKLSMTVSGKQLEWLEEQLKMYRDQGKEFIIVQGHVPVFGPVESKNSSANMLEGGTDTEFWEIMVKYGVDVYLCGEHHRITVKERDGIWQIVHGALWGTQLDVNYLRGSVYPGKLKLELFQFLVDYSDEYIQTDHPHRGPANRPRTQVTIPKHVRENGPDSLGKLIFEIGNEKKSVKGTGIFK
jgi:hypothetical protein